MQAMDQKALKPKKLSASIEYKDAKAELRTEDTSLNDIMLVSILVAGAVALVYVARVMKLKGKDGN